MDNSRQIPSWVPSPKPDSAASPPNPRTGAAAARPPAMRSFGRSLTRLLPPDLPLLPAGAAMRPELRQHRRDRAVRAAGAPLSPWSTTTSPAPGAPLGCRQLLQRGQPRELPGDTPAERRGQPRPRGWKRSVLTAAGGRARSPGAWRQRGRCCGAAAAALTRSRIAARGREGKRREGEVTGGATTPLRPRALCGTRRGRAAAAPSAGRGREEPGGPRESEKEQRDGKEKKGNIGGREEMEKEKVTGKK